MIEEATVPLGNDLEIPCLRAVGASDGPHVTLISGVHGAEYCSVAGVRRFTAALDTRELSGRVTALPVVNPTAFWTRTPFVTPEDGKNLNRVFPGNAEGTFSESLAHELFERFVRGSDYVVHVHGGSTLEYVEPFVGYDGADVADVAPEVERASRELALAYGLKYVLRSERVGLRGSPTMLRTAAAEAGIPSLLTEAGDQGFLDESDVAVHARGLRRVLERLEMLPRSAADVPVEQTVVHSFVAVKADREAWWEPSVTIGELVDVGTELGTLYDLFGASVASVHAPVAGVCLVLTTSPAAAEGSVLAYLGTDLEPVA
jgi:predicted deacylase